MLRKLFTQFRVPFLVDVGEYIRFVIKACTVSIYKFPKWRLISSQMLEIGIMSLPVVAITGFSTGLVLSAQSFFQLADKGLAAATGILVGKAMITELGPILTAFMITGRVGSAMCAELGSMKVTEQIDALRSMSVNPIRYLVAPRLIGGFITIPLLTIFSIVMGILGGYLIAVYLFGMSPGAYFDPMPDYISPFDLFTGIFKALIFGVFIVTICCFKGLNTTNGAVGVGRATTTSVVIAYSVILIANFLLTLALNIIHEFITGPTI
jgi:phospholipid/cholesterol/gamma-HCH transport system permease protein